MNINSSMKTIKKHYENEKKKIDELDHNECNDPQVSTVCMYFWQFNN